MFGAKQSLLMKGERRKLPPGRGGRVKQSSRDHKWPLRRRNMYRTQKKPDTDENHAREGVSLTTCFDKPKPAQQNFVTATCRKWSNQTSLLPRGSRWGSPLQHKEASAKEREIKRNLCDLLRRQSSVAETKIFTKILQYIGSDLSLPCVAT